MKTNNKAAVMPRARMITAVAITAGKLKEQRIKATETIRIRQVISAGVLRASEGNAESVKIN